MSLADELAAEPTVSNRAQCWFTRHALSDEDSAAVRKRLLDIAAGAYTAAELARIMKRNGYEIGTSTIARHVTGMCGQCDYGPR